MKKMLVLLITCTLGVISVSGSSPAQSPDGDTKSQAFTAFSKGKFTKAAKFFENLYKNDPSQRNALRLVHVYINIDEELTTATSYLHDWSQLASRDKVVSLDDIEYLREITDGLNQRARRDVSDYKEKLKTCGGPIPIIDVRTLQEENARLKESKQELELELDMYRKQPRHDPRPGPILKRPEQDRVHQPER
ncbi:MAG: hypothetical protein Tsb0020_15910 [Haliangiales bacterium]